MSYRPSHWVVKLIFIQTFSIAKFVKGVVFPLKTLVKCSHCETSLKYFLLFTAGWLFPVAQRVGSTGWTLLFVYKYLRDNSKEMTNDCPKDPITVYANFFLKWKLQLWNKLYDFCPSIHYLCGLDLNSRVPLIAVRPQCENFQILFFEFIQLFQLIKLELIHVLTKAFDDIHLFNMLSLSTYLHIFTYHFACSCYKRSQLSVALNNKKKLK